MKKKYITPQMISVKLALMPLLDVSGIQDWIDIGHGGGDEAGAKKHKPIIVDDLEDEEFEGDSILNGL